MIKHVCIFNDRRLVTPHHPWCERCTESSMPPICKAINDPDKIKLVVLNENVLGTIIYDHFNTVDVLKASIIKGDSGSLNPRSFVSPESVRLASPKDFEDFNVSFDGFNSEEYIFAK